VSKLDSLGKKATSGIFWSALERVGQQSVSFFVQIVLARLLAPEQFGLIAMVVVFISVSSVLIDAGFSRALIQRKEVSDSDLSTVFYFNLGAAALIAALLYVSAPSIAASNVACGHSRSSVSHLLNGSGSDDGRSDPWPDDVALPMRSL
tara:strand:- start:412 stop:858 length:447 start_codon:yes stop_codon:yes gene_type:complete